MTIAAVSTAPGIGGIAIIRVSGPDAIRLTDGLFRGRRRLADTAGYRCVYGTLVSPAGEELDDGVCTVFRAPHSFTGEDTVEIACHGSLYVQKAILEALVDSGCRTAGPGEFTRRAFVNGKLDLTEAEAVADLIAAQSKAEKDLALSQLRGGVREELRHLRGKLLHLTSLLELELDFADHEELEFADRSELAQLAETIRQKLSELCGSFRSGQAIKNGIRVAIVGPTNAGKSTLLNALVGEERAIVSDIHGTTRDTIEDTLTLGGLLFRLIDTAGLRDTSDRIEALGIERSRRAIEEADLVIDLGETEGIASEKRIAVTNKIDLPGIQAKGIGISAREKQIEPLCHELIRRGKELTETHAAVTISNMRHYEALTRAREAIVRVQQGMADGLSGELLSLDLQDCLTALGEITGEITNDEVLGNIFRHFCIGK